METVVVVASYFLCALMGAAVTAASLPFVHILQLESYQGRMYLKWMGRHIGSDFVPCLFAGGVALVLRASYVLFYSANPVIAKICYSAADFVYIAMLALLYYSYIKHLQVKPLVYTGRVKRLLVAEWVLATLFSAMFFVNLSKESGGWGEYLAPFAVRYLPGLLLPLFVLLPYGLLYPVEEGVKRYYFNDAKKRLAKNPDMIRIGITGSFGKTGTKYALGEILSNKYNVLITPGSYNTPMGVTRVIREQLKEEHKVFVAEMGARYKGDIRELCRLVKPEFGIITAVGKQHLETFGSLDNIIQTKSELIRGLGEDGCAFLNGDDENCRKIYEQSTLNERYLYGTQGEDLFMRAGEIHTGPEGSSFTLTAENGESVCCKTKLLGRHNILNLTGAAACAYRLGMPLEEIALGIAKAEPVEHRLQLIPGAVTVIDDAFNANPLGSREALNVLASFEGKKRVIVTPGMVELGAEEKELNREFGRHIARCADIALIVGKTHADPICEGLLAAGFPQENLIRVPTLAKATELLPTYATPGSVVLFENDLPDNYAE